MTEGSRLPAIWQEIKRRRAVALASAASLVLTIGSWLWAFFALRGSEQPLIIHFNNMVGINRIGGVEDLMIVGLFGFAAVAANSFLAFALDGADWFWGKFVAAATFGFSVLLFIGFAAIISVN